MVPEGASWGYRGAVVQNPRGDGRAELALASRTDQLLSGSVALVKLPQANH